jgi:chemotaxis protein CheD
MHKISEPDFFIEIFLQPGEFYFGDKDTRIRTLLGSCVAITLWHPLLRIGGMCHFLLPTNTLVKVGSQLDGRYADQAMQMFMRELELSKTSASEYEVKIFGGGSQFTTHAKHANMSVPDKNISAGYALLKQYGFKVKAGNSGGTGHRNVIFDVWSGHVWLRHVETG